MNKFIVDWLECECGGDVEVTTESEDSLWVEYGDSCVCKACGAVGEIDCDDGLAWVNWSEE